jgi:hypothetical protein
MWAGDRVGLKPCALVEQVHVGTYLHAVHIIDAPTQRVLAPWVVAPNKNCIPVRHDATLDNEQKLCSNL